VTPWNAKHWPVAAIAGSPFSRVRTLPDSRFQAKASTSASIDDSMGKTPKRIDALIDSRINR
jgi:hypothetical protein